MSCIVSHGVVFCQMTPLGFAFAVWFLVSLGVLTGMYFTPEDE